MSTTIRLTDEERAAMREIVGINAIDVGEQIEHAESADALDRAIARAQRHARLMRAGEAGVLEVDDSIAEELREHHKGVLECLTYERDCLNKLRQGDLGWCAQGQTPAESERETLTYMDGLLDEVSACESILARPELEATR